MVIQYCVYIRDGLTLLYLYHIAVDCLADAVTKLMNLWPYNTADMSLGCRLLAQLMPQQNIYSSVLICGLTLPNFGRGIYLTLLGF
jgi:hypothetical protein